MDTFPKLLPMWHDVALQEFLKRNGDYYKMQYPPNYGGIGIDINNSNYRNSSNIRKQINLASSSCALPFLPLNEIHCLEDPCLGALKREKFEFKKFCVKLTYIRNSAKRCKSWAKLKTLQQYLNTCMQNNGNVEGNIKIPKSLAYLAENIPKQFFFPKYNVAYAGGALGISKVSNNLNLLHPVAGAQNKLYFCCVRQKSSFHLVNMNNMDVFTKKVHQLPLYYVAVSPYNPTEILCVQEKGTMKLINIETRKTSSISENLFECFLVYPTWRCSFGSHLFSAFCMNEKKVYNIDFREKNCMKREIFCIDNPSCYLAEELVAMKLWNKNPYQHLLTSSHHFIICDERYPKKPVLYWNHTMKDPPIYLECTDLDSNLSCIAIGTQDTQEQAAFLFSHETNIQAVTVTPPLLLSSPTDCVESLKLHSYYVDDKFFSRLSNPLSGICIVPHTNDLAFSILQSTSLGDIFYQTFKESDSSEKTYKVSTGCVLTPPEKILPHLKYWLSSTNNEKEVHEEIDESISLLQVNINEILSPSKQISSSCTMCRLKNSSSEKELVFSEVCPSCNLNSAESQQYSEAESNTSAIIGPTTEESSFLNCDLDYLSRFEDIYSKKILSVWLESDDFEDRQPTFDQSMTFGDF